MIRCIWRVSPCDPTQRRDWVAPWDENATVAALTPETLRGVEDVRVRVDGVEVPLEDWSRVVPDGAIVEWRLGLGDLFSVGAAISAFGLNLAPQIGTLSVAGIQTGITASASSLAVAATIGNLAFAAGLSALLGGLLKQKPPKPGEQDSATYGFGGVATNPAYAGAPYPMVLGEMRVAGPIINLYTEALPVQDEYLYVLILLAGHRVESIGGITEDGGPFDGDELPLGLQIDGEDARNFDDLECWVRMGRENQDPIPGFAAPVLQYQVGRTLLESEADPTGAEQTPGVYDPTDSEITAWDTCVGVTTEVEADWFNAILRFPRGLYTVSGTAFADRTVRLQARYRRATNGTPVGNYVVLPAFDVTADKGTPFSFPFGADFLDPETYVEPDPGHYLELTHTTNDHGDTANLTLATQDADETTFSAMVWVRCADITTAGNRNLLLHFASNRGFGLRIIITASLGGAPLYQLSCTMGDGSGSLAVTDKTDKTLKHHIDSPPPQTNGFVLVGFSYEASYYEDGRGCVRFYSNGIMIGEADVAITDQIRWPTSAPVIAGATSTAGVGSLDGDLQELLIFDRVLSEVEFRSFYNGGYPQPCSASYPGLVAGWHFHETNSGGTTTPGILASQNMTLGNSAAISTLTDTGPVPEAAAGVTLRDRYLIEVQRVTTELTTDLSGDEVQWSSLQIGQNDEFEYPGLALLAVRMRATGQVSGVPAVTVPVRGARVPIWDGVDELNPAITYEWSRNPAWCLAYAATDPKLGAGSIFGLDNIDWAEFRAFSVYCDAKLDCGEPALDAFDPPGGTFDALEVEQASTSVGTDPVFTGGLVIFRVAAHEWPVTAPAAFDTSVSSTGAEHFYRIVAADSGLPAWLAALDGETLPVGKILFVGNGGGGVGQASYFELWLHPPADPGTDATYNPGSGETITATRYERRMEFDGVFDRPDFPRWEALRVIAKSAFGEPLKIGSKLSITFDHALNPSHVLSMGNTVAGSFSTTYSGLSARTNTIEGTYLDRSRNYEKVPITLKHPNVVNPAILSSLRVAQESFEGITRRSQVERAITRKLNYYNLSRRMYEARGGPDMLGIGPGQLIAVAHDVPGWGTASGRLQLDSPDNETLYLDRDVVLESGTTYQIGVRNAATGALQVRTVDETAGTYPAGTPIAVTSAFGFQPTEDAVYVLGPEDRLYMEFLVIKRTLDPVTLISTITAIQYSDSIYDEGFAELPDPISTLSPPVVA